MLYITTFALRRALPHTLPLATRTIMARGITSNLFIQPLHVLLPLLVRVIRRGLIPWIAKPLSTIVNPVLKMTLPFLIKMLITSIIYRIGANLIKTFILWPLRIIVVDVLAALTPLTNVDWYVKFNKALIPMLKNILESSINNLDSIFSFALQHSWYITLVTGFIGILYSIYKIDNLTAWINSIFTNNPLAHMFLNGLGEALIRTVKYICWNLPISLSLFIYHGAEYAIGLSWMTLKAISISLGNIWSKPLNFLLIYLSGGLDLLTAGILKLWAVSRRLYRWIITIERR